MTAATIKRCDIVLFVFLTCCLLLLLLGQGNGKAEDQELVLYLREGDTPNEGLFSPVQPMGNHSPLRVWEESQLPVQGERVLIGSWSQLLEGELVSQEERTANLSLTLGEGLGSDNESNLVKLEAEIWLGERGPFITEAATRLVGEKDQDFLLETEPFTLDMVAGENFTLKLFVSWDVEPTDDTGPLELVFRYDGLSYRSKLNLSCSQVSFPKIQIEEDKMRLNVDFTVFVQDAFGVKDLDLDSFGILVTNDGGHPVAPAEALEFLGYQEGKALWYWDTNHYLKIAGEYVANFTVADIRGGRWAMSQSFSLDPYSYRHTLEAAPGETITNKSANPEDLPQGGVSYSLRLHNLENSSNFVLKVETDTTSGIYKGWSITLEAAYGRTARLLVPSELPGWDGDSYLHRDQYAEITVFVTPPAGVNPPSQEPYLFDHLNISFAREQASWKKEFLNLGMRIARPDLRITNADLSVDTSEKNEEGDSVDLGVTIHNDGLGVAGAFDVWVYRTREQSLPGVGGTVDQNGLLVHEIVEGSILPGGSLFLEMDWEIEWGKHELYVVVDKPIPSGEDSTLDPLRGDVLEQNETNNAASLNSSLAEYIDLRPWIQIEDIDNEDDVVKDDTIVITVTIYNNDSHNAVATYGEAEDDVDMYIRCKAGGDFLKPKTGSGSAYSGYKVNEELEPGDELEIEFEWKVQDDEGTDVRIKAYIDYHQNKNPENTLKVEMKVKRISYGPPRHSYFPWGSYILCGAFWLASMGLAAFFSKESRCMRCPGLKQRNRSLRYPKGTRKKGNRLSSKNKKQTRKPWTAPELRIREMGSPPQEEHQEPRPGSLLKNEH